MPIQETFGPAAGGVRRPAPNIDNKLSIEAVRAYCAVPFLRNQTAGKFSSFASSAPVSSLKSTTTIEPAGV